jgi:hypothetical protein
VLGASARKIDPFALVTADGDVSLFEILYFVFFMPPLVCVVCPEPIGGEWTVARKAHRQKKK